MNRRGWLLTITGFLACPCHLPLWIIFLSGTTFGGVIAANQGLIAVAMSLYGIPAFAIGLRRLVRGQASCSVPTPRQRLLNQRRRSPLALRRHSVEP